MSSPSKRAELELYNQRTELHNHAMEITLSGRYEDAMPLWDRLIAESEGHSDAYLGYAKRGITYLLMGKPQQALPDLLASRAVQPQIVYPLIGVAYWLHGEKEAACEAWVEEMHLQHARQVNYYDETGGVAPLLWWASAHPSCSAWRKRAVQELRRHWKTRRTRNSQWPGSIVGFLLGHLSEAALLDAAQCRHYPAVAVEQGCQAHFYLGALALDHGDMTRYRAELVQVPVEPRIILDAEYFLACEELSRLGDGAT